MILQAMALFVSLTPFGRRVCVSCHSEQSEESHPSYKFHNNEILRLLPQDDIIFTPTS